MKNKAIFFDRDGVLNNAIIKHSKPFPPRTLAELTIPNDAFESLSTLKNLGYYLIGATNQPDITRGTTSKAFVESIHKHLMATLPLDEIFTCYHDNNDKCQCRKPMPGLLLEAANKYQIDLKNSFMIGDRWKDIDAGKNAGCKTIWIKHNYDEQAANNPSTTVSSLTEATEWIMNNNFT